MEIDTGRVLDIDIFISQVNACIGECGNLVINSWDSRLSGPILIGAGVDSCGRHIYSLLRKPTSGLRAVRNPCKISKALY